MKHPAPLAAVVGTSRPSGDAREHEAVCADLAEALPVGDVRIATGACGGFPDRLGHAFHARGGFVWGYSPAESLEEHVGRWASPSEGFTELRFGFGGLMEREVAMIRDCDFVIALGGNVGTLSELCMAVKLERPILVVTGLPGIAPEFPDLVAHLDPYPAPRIACVDASNFGSAVHRYVGRIAA